MQITTNININAATVSLRSSIAEKSKLPKKKKQFLQGIENVVKRVERKG